MLGTGQPLERFFIQRSLQDLKQHCFFTAPLHDGSKARSQGGAASNTKNYKYGSAKQLNSIASPVKQSEALPT